MLYLEAIVRVMLTLVRSRVIQIPVFSWVPNQVGLSVESGRPVQVEASSSETLVITGSNCFKARKMLVKDASRYVG